MVGGSGKVYGRVFVGSCRLGAVGFGDDVSVVVVVVAGSKGDQHIFDVFKTFSNHSHPFLFFYGGACLTSMTSVRFACPAQHMKPQLKAIPSHHKTMQRVWVGSLCKVNCRTNGTLVAVRPTLSWIPHESEFVFDYV